MFATVVLTEEVSRQLETPWQGLWKNRDARKVWGTTGHTNPPEEQPLSTLERKAFEHRDAEGQCALEAAVHRERAVNS